MDWLFPPPHSCLYPWTLDFTLYRSKIDLTCFYHHAEVFFQDDFSWTIQHPESNIRKLCLYIINWWWQHFLILLEPVLADNCTIGPRHVVVVAVQWGHHPNNQMQDHDEIVRGQSLNHQVVQLREWQSATRGAVWHHLATKEFKWGGGAASRRILPTAAAARIKTNKESPLPSGIHG